MRKKLLNKTLGANLLFSMVLMVIAAPSFYIITQKLYLAEIDETLLLKNTEILNELKKGKSEEELLLLNRFNKDFKIEAASFSLSKDSFFFQMSYDSILKENEHYRLLKSPIKLYGKDFILTAKISLLESEDFQENVALLFTAILLFLFFGFYIITRWQSQKLWKPFYHALEEIEHIEIDKQRMPEFKTTNIEEFARLNQAMEQWMKKNKAIFDSHREFIDNAAHELQTPLAVFQGKIDILIQRPDITEGQSEILNELNQAIGRMNKLNKNLLLLSKLESNQFIETSEIDLNEVVQRQLMFFKEQALSKSISIDIASDAVVKVKCNGLLAEVFISNLFLNALKYNVVNGIISVKLSQHSFAISNSGISQALDEDQLFKRFTKINPSSDGNGLGLSIVCKIVELNGWKIQYKFKHSLHSFEIYF